MIYKVVDRRALGGASVFGSPMAAPQRQTAPVQARKTLGQASQLALAVTQAQYDLAKAIYERIRVNYQELASIMGQENADQALREAQAFMDASAQAHNDSLEVAK